MLESSRSNMLSCKPPSHLKDTKLYYCYYSPLIDPCHCSSGYKVVATASAHNWPLLKSLGVEEVLNYKDPNCR